MYSGGGGCGEVLGVQADEGLMDRPAGGCEACEHCYWSGVRENTREAGVV